MGGRCVLDVIVHGSLITVSHHHGVSFVAVPIIVEQGFERQLSMVVGHLHVHLYV